MRLEAKYLLEPRQLAALRGYARAICRPDPHQPPGATGYRIHSVYFDTASLEEYQAKMDGQSRRRKMRLRWYGPASRWPRRPILEFKCRDRDGMWKIRQPLSFPETPQPVSSGLVAACLETVEGAEFGEISRRLQARNLIPVVHITYLRQAWLDAGDGGFRMTLDTDVRARSMDPGAGIDAPGEGAWREVIRPGRGILELKADGAFPPWTRGLILRMGLRRIAISKYCGGVDVLGIKAKRNARPAWDMARSPGKERA